MPMPRLRALRNKPSFGVASPPLGEGSACGGLVRQRRDLARKRHNASSARGQPANERFP
jgi:hypothetical protein